SDLPAQKLGDHLKLGKAKNEIHVLDVGAGSGIWGIALAQKSPRVRVTAVDWAGMIPTTKRITQKFGVGDRFNYVEGDMLEVNFGSGYDIATLGHILHSEGEDRSRQLLRKIFRALKSGGTIAIAEWLVNDDRTRPLPSLMFAVQMLVNTEKGDTFSFNEIKNWLEEADFKKVRKLEAPGRSPMQNRASMIVTVYKRFSTKQRERQRLCRETRLRSIGLIFRQCCVWSVPIIARDTIRLRMIRCYGLLLLSTIWSIHST